MPNINPLPLLQRLAGVALALALAACSSTPKQTTQYGVTWGEAPVIPLNTQPYPWHLMPSPQPAPAAVAPAAWPAAAPPTPPARPVAVAPPPPPTTEAPATVAPPIVRQQVSPKVTKTGTRHTHTHTHTRTYTHTHPRRTQKTTTTAPAKVTRPSSSARTTAPQRAARTNTPRAPKGPLDCATLLSTNPYLANLLGCAPGAPNVRAPGASAAKGTAPQ